MNITVTADPAHFDVRSIPCRVKHAQIIQRWLETPVGQHFMLINDHDPVPRYYQFASIFAGEFMWERLIAGPEVFHVKISRVAAGKNSAPPPPVAGGCGHYARHAEKEDMLNVRGLEPPQPMMHILAAAAQLAPGATLRARTDRKSLHLLPELEARGIRHVCDEQADGSWVTSLTRP